jgi:drug/metabolite transporter (DMT)-like permease
MLRRSVRDKKIMTQGQLIGILMGVSNLLVGALLSAFYKPIGSGLSALGKRTGMDKLVGPKLYEEKNSRRLVLIVGIWLILWGIIAFFLIPAITGKNP